MQTTRFAFEAIGTHWEIDIASQVDEKTRSGLLKRISARIEQFDKDYSRFRNDSLVVKMSRETGTFRLPADGEQMLNIYKELYGLTRGKFTPLVGRLMEDIGYDARYSLVSKRRQKPSGWEEAMSYKWPNLEIKTPVMLDFGAGGKGYLIDIVGKIIYEYGLRFFCIYAGGDLVYYSETGEKLRVGLEDPDDPKKVIGVATIGNESICGSSGNRRKWKNFHHIVDPVKLTSVRGVKATWVVAKNALLADSLATALFLVTRERLQKKYDFSCVVLNQNREVRVCESFPGKVFLK